MLSDICSNPFSEVVPIWSISSGFLRIVRQNQNRILHGNHAILINNDWCDVGTLLDALRDIVHRLIIDPRIILIRL